MNSTSLFLFALVALAVIATPGPTVLLALINGSHYGVRRSVPGMLGAVASDFVLVGAVALGLGALLAASEFWFSALKWVGAWYLAWLGVRMLRSGFAAPALVTSCTSRPPEGVNFTRGGPSENCGFESPTAGAGPMPRNGRAIFMKSFLVAATNPKGYLFCSALLPQFIDPAAAQAPQYVAIALVFAGIDFSVMLAYAFIGARAIKLLKANATRWLDRLCGGALLALAGSLAFYRRSTA